LKKNNNFFILASACLLFGILCAPLFGIADGTYQLSQEQLVDLVQPSVLRITNEIKGQLSIPPFSVDLNTLQPVFDPSAVATETPVDDYITGSGFIVSPDGYIVTNSHVVSSSDIEEDILAQLWLDTLTNQVSALSQAQATQVQNNLQQKFGSLNDSDYQKIGDQILQPLKDKGQFNVENTVVVLNPSSANNNLTQLIQSGFPAKVVSENPNFAQDQRDVALIKIDQTNLPALALAPSTDLASGQGIFVFSYPSTATFDSKDFLQPSFTPGVISAIKTSDSGDFKIYQTDAKISTGSSGSPLIDDQGRVNAVITFETGSADAGNGDNFAFALPIDLVNSMLSQNGVTNDYSVFYQPFLQGLTLQSQRHCQAAISQFQRAEQANSDFISYDKIQKYISDCQDTIKAGNSLDGRWDYVRDWLKHVPTWVWYTLAGVLLLSAGLILVIVRQSRWLKKEEQEIQLLETEVDKDHKAIEAEEARGIGVTANNPAVAVPEQTQNMPPIPLPVNPDLMAYIRKGRQAGMGEQDLRLELTKAGWPEQEINHGIKTE
jgi:S1-C subfamily serine protease